METTTLNMRRQDGFTLVEILAVLAILGVLMTIAVLGLGRQTERARMAETKARLGEIENLITSYELKFGDYPPDSLKMLKVKADNNINEGIEACVAALHGKDHPTGTLMSEEAMGNTDGDETTTDYHRAGVSYLLEVVDSWGNPIAYFHNSSYGRTDMIQLSDEAYSEYGEMPVEAFESETTGVYANADSYQLISAGPDSEFGTGDDVTNF